MGGKSTLFRLVRNGFAHFVRKVFARRKLLPGKFWVFPPLDVMLVAPCCLPVSATALALLSAISYWLWQNVVSKHPKTKSKDIFYLKNQELSQYMSSWKGSFNFALSSVSLWQLAIHLDISTIFWRILWNQDLRAFLQVPLWAFGILASPSIWIIMCCTPQRFLWRLFKFGKALW